MTMETEVKEQLARQAVSEELSRYETTEVWPARKVLFREGEEARGVYLIHSGEIDLTFAPLRSGEAKALLVAGQGDVLGLASILSGKPHDCSAETRTPCITGFVQKEELVRLLDEKPALWINVLRLISSNISACWDCMRGLR